MKKNIILLLICFIYVFSSGCTKYIHASCATSDFYGTYKTRDLINAEVIMYKKNSNIICNGEIFLRPDKKLYYLINSPIDGNIDLGCSDKTLIRARITMTKPRFDKLNGSGYDQLDNLYSFETISGKVFRQNIDKRQYKTFKHNSQSNLKY